MNPGTIIVVVVVISVIVLATVLMALSMSKKSLAWLNKGMDGYGGSNPTDVYKQLRQVLGNPSVMDQGPGGFALWSKKALKRKDLPYERVWIRDEQIPHATPSSHVDFLYVTVDYKVPADKVADIMGLSESVWVDKLKQQITARCHFMGACKATLLLAMRIANGETTLADVQSKDELKLLISATQNTSSNYSSLAEKEYDREIATKSAVFLAENSRATSWGVRP